MVRVRVRGRVRVRVRVVLVGARLGPHGRLASHAYALA